MNILFAHSFSPCGLTECLGKAIQRKNHNVTFYNIDETVNWTDIRGILPFYIPKGMPTTVKSLVKRFGVSFDMVIECGGRGQHHLIRNSIPTIHYSIDEHEPIKRKFENWIQKDFDMIFACHKDAISEVF